MVHATNCVHKLLFDVVRAKFNRAVPSYMYITQGTLVYTKKITNIINNTDMKKINNYKD